MTVSTSPNATVSQQGGTEGLTLLTSADDKPGRPLFWGLPSICRKQRQSVAVAFCTRDESTGEVVGAEAVHPAHSSQQSNTVCFLAGGSLGLQETFSNV